MKLAIAGKGGVGKTSISGTLARVLARSGQRVLAIDGDSNPNLALTLGIGPEAMREMPTLPSDLIERKDGNVELKQSLDRVVEAHSLRGPDGVTLLIMAHPQHAGTGCLCGMHATVRTLIDAAANAPDEVCILDTEASPEHLSRGTAVYADAMLMVVEPYFKSLETGRRMALLGRDLGIEKLAFVANKIRDERELEAVNQFAAQNGLEVAGVVPFDETLPESERASASPLDFAPDSAAVAAITELAERFVVNGHGNGAVANGARSG